MRCVGRAQEIRTGSTSDVRGFFAPRIGIQRGCRPFTSIDDISQVVGSVEREKCVVGVRAACAAEKILSSLPLVLGFQIVARRREGWSERMSE